MTEIELLKDEVEKLRQEVKELAITYDRALTNALTVFLGGCIRIGGVNPDHIEGQDAENN